MQWQTDVSLRDLNTFGFEATAERFVQLESRADVEAVHDYATEHHLPLLILGGGSNLVLGSRVPGVVAKMAIRERQIEEKNQQVLVTLGAGENWHDSVRWLLAQGIYGAENLALIPGQVGSAPVQNIGAYGVELKDVAAAVEVYDRDNGLFGWIPAADCGFAYRDSRFKQSLDRYIITRVQLSLSRIAKPVIGYAGLHAAVGDNPTPEQIFDAVCALRRSKLPDPKVLGNAGSFFKNPVISESVFSELKHSFPDIVSYPDVNGVKLAAGWLIDRAGFKGVRRQTVGVHDRQALVLINIGGGTAEELTRLATEIQTAVNILFGVKLEPEPRFYP